MSLKKCSFITQIDALIKSKDIVPYSQEFSYQSPTYLLRWRRFTYLKLIWTENAQWSCLQFHLVHFIHRQIWYFKLSIKNEKNKIKLKFYQHRMCHTYLNFNMFGWWINLKLPIKIPYRCLKANDVKIDGVIIKHWSFPFYVNCSILLACKICENWCSRCRYISTLKYWCWCITIITRCNCNNHNFIFSIWSYKS